MYIYCCAECSRISWYDRSILSIGHNWKFAEERSRIEVTDRRAAIAGATRVWRTLRSESNEF